ncbi:DUF962 domain-containing protein [Shewanella sp. SR44-3]|uniref:DUF962 domain-containing protein n=1 Tax=unclassified Shewanella TaxID=196818 RepID=UPI0015FD5AD1|nr:DUF962 domain-containing protein [Shewanella sp. SR44-3]MBB1270555.1 DUF962 domain-containing protein [Shewanella sp. SR44-3]
MNKERESPNTFSCFRDFYPYYLSEHSNLFCRRCHFVGSALTLIALISVISLGAWGYLLTLPLIGYGFAWFGHFVFEKNRPATFSYPFYSFLGDWLMFWQMLTGQIR